jgi:hypothetical protein
MLKRHSQLVFSIISRTNFINDPKYFSYLNGNQSKLFLNYINKDGGKIALYYTEGIIFYIFLRLVLETQKPAEVLR